MAQIIDLVSTNKIISHPTWDIVAIFVFLIIGFFYGLWAGRTKLIAFLISLYVSGFLFENFYYLTKLVKGGSIIERFTFETIIFTLLAIVLTILFAKLLEPQFESGPKNWLKSFLISFSSIGLFFSYLFHILPAKEAFTFSPLVQNLFASNSAFFWWLFIPLIVLFWTK